MPAALPSVALGALQDHGLGDLSALTTVSLAKEVLHFKAQARSATEAGL